MQKALRHHEWLRIFVGIWFQVLFHRPPGLLFTFPSRYLFTIDHQKYLAFPDRSGRFARGSRASSYSGTVTGIQNFSITGLLPSMVVRSRIVHLNVSYPYATALQPLQKQVWAPPCSLAATKGIRLLLNVRDTQTYTTHTKEDTTVSFPPLTEMFYFSGYGSAVSTTADL